MDIRKFFPGSQGSSGSSQARAPKTPAKTFLSQERNASQTPVVKRSQKVEFPKKSAPVLLSSDESDGESPLTADIKKELKDQRRRRAIVVSDDDDGDIPTLVSQISQPSPVKAPSPRPETSKAAKRKRQDVVAPTEPKRTKKSLLLESDSEPDLPSAESDDDEVHKPKKGRRKRTPPGLQKLDAFAKKGSRGVNAPKFEPKATAAKHAKPPSVDPIAFFNNFGRPSPSVGTSTNKTPTKKAESKVTKASPSDEKENTGKSRSAEKTKVAEKTSPVRKTPRKTNNAEEDQVSTSATPVKKKRASKEDKELPAAEVGSDRKKTSAKKSSRKSNETADVPAEKETDSSAKSPAKIAKKSSPAKTAQKSPAKPTTTVKKSSSTADAQRVQQINEVTTAKLTAPMPKQPAELPWVDKYKPAKPVELVGQLTEKSPYNKLMTWLRNWHKHNLGEGALEKKVKPAPFAKNDDGRAFKAALLSGPPGIGKTTSAVMACKELGVTYTELNASDARNKKKMEMMVGESLESRGMDMWMMKKQTAPTEVSHVLIMDEVDGMSGNQDRAGIAELILMIKRSKIPIICICNDRQSQKIRSLANHCFDLRFNRPQAQQIKGRLMTIISREKLKVPKELVDKIIEASNQDIRQCIYSLQLVAAGLSSEKELQQKDVSVNIFEAARRLLSTETNLMEKQEMFFTDYSIMPLFVQENYANVKSRRMSLLEHVRSLQKAADSIVMGDIIDRQIRSGGSWNLLTDQAMMACALPCLYMDGHLTEQLQFPSWLGRNSTSGKRQRLMRQLASHTHLKISGTSHALVTDYIPVLRDRMYRPLAKHENAGVPEVVALYTEYDILRDDTEAIDELGIWPQFPDVAKSVNSKTKAALTRALNKESRLLPYALEEAVKGRRRGAASVGGDAFELDEEGHVIETAANDQEDDDAADDEDLSGNGGGAAGKNPADDGGKKAAKASTGGRGKGRGGRGGK